MATAMAQLCGQLCGTCNLPYNRFSARPQLIPCARMACQVKIHWQCHLPKMDSKEFLVTKRYGKFSFVCPKCTTTGPPREEPAGELPREEPTREEHTREGPTGSRGN